MPPNWEIYCDNEGCQSKYAHFHSSYCTVGCDHWEEEKAVTGPCVNGNRCHYMEPHKHGVACDKNCDCKEKQVNVEESSTEYTQVTTAEWTALKDKALNAENAKEQYLRERDEARRELEELKSNKEVRRKIMEGQDRQIRNYQGAASERQDHIYALSKKLRKAKRAIKNLSGAWK